MSPLELRREFEADKMRRIDAMNRDISTAWYAAVLSRMDKVPRLQSLLVTGQTKRQSLAEQRAVLQTISEQYRLPIRKVVH